MLMAEMEFVWLVSWERRPWRKRKIVERCLVPEGDIERLLSLGFSLTPSPAPGACRRNAARPGDSRQEQSHQTRADTVHTSLR